MQDRDDRKPRWPMTIVRTWASDDKIKYDALQGPEWFLKDQIWSATTSMVTSLQASYEAL